MNKLICFCLLFLNYYAYGQCGYYYFQNDKTITMGMFDHKGKQDGKYVYRVSNVSNSGASTTATIQSEVFDKKGKSIGGGTGTMECKGGVFMIDMKMMVSPQQMEQFKNAKVEGKSSYMIYPASLSVGQTLDDGNFDMDMSMNGGMMANLRMDVTNRKVEAKENVTTPAGSWDAYKITYETKTTINMGISIPFKMQMTEWFVPNFGVVKSSSRYGTQELISIQ